ncbi:MAG: WecB/TagA/CpsF family glycosyltransferase [Microcoleaceae cyanobacterium]
MIEKTKSSVNNQVATALDSVKILNVSIDNLATHTLLEKLRQGGVVFTPNVDHLVKLQNDPDFFDVYSQADYIVCDSKILMYVSDFLGSPIQEKISGSDLFPAFYEYYRNDPEMTIFLLGAAEGVAELAQEKINQKVGREMVIGTYSPPFGFEKDEAECDKIIDMVNASKATVLAVGVGAPKQEKWICKYRNRLDSVKVFLAIGATIDFEAGYRQRSPEWMSAVGLEWLYRIVEEPKRLWKRYLIDSLPFFRLVLQQKLNLYRYNMRIGHLLLEAGLLTYEQIGIILNYKKENPDLLFGEIVVKQGWLKQETVDFFAEHLAEIQQEKNKNPIGQYLKQAGLIDDEKISQILQQQQTSDLRFGEIADAQGWVKQKTTNFIIETTGAKASRGQK